MKTYGKHRFPGRLFIVEGIDGSGKSTQLSLLQKWLESEGCHNASDKEINRAAENNSMMQRDGEHLLDLAANRVRSLSQVTN
jgi:thymidylate kinase